jgi:DNA-binding NtrC family response regulator
MSVSSAATPSAVKPPAARGQAADLAAGPAEAGTVFSLAGLVGESEAFCGLLRTIRTACSASRLPILFTGESGTGKTALVGALHAAASDGGPLVRVDCTTLPAAEAEAQARLFGVADAPDGSAPPWCELAGGGTLFLDEIGGLPPGLQAALLQLVEDGRYLPLGATASRPLNARVIATTHADLPARVAAGHFRRDLYYRLARFPIAVPPLRERLEDVPVLVRHFLPRLAKELHLPAPPVRPEALQRLIAHNYPGNVRELRHTLERALLHADGADLGPEHVVFAPVAGPDSAGTVPEGPLPGGVGELGRQLLGELPLNLAEAEDILIGRAVTIAEGNLSRAARLLGINRASLYRWQERRAPRRA